MLCDHSIPIHQIAYQLGYGDTTAFIRHFAARAGPARAITRINTADTVSLSIRYQTVYFHDSRGFARPWHCSTRCTPVRYWWSQA